MMTSMNVLMTLIAVTTMLIAEILLVVINVIAALDSRVMVMNVLMPMNVFQE